VEDNILIQWTGDVPLPVSVNEAFRNLPKVGRVKTKKYTTWERQASIHLNSKAFPLNQIGQYARNLWEIRMYTYLSTYQRDIDNVEKVLVDLLAERLGLRDNRLVYKSNLRKDTKGKETERVEFIIDVLKDTH
jgi:Holliday junction resolvase RusA-like endonuclease